MVVLLSWTRVVLRQVDMISSWRQAGRVASEELRRPTPTSTFGQSSTR